MSALDWSRNQVTKCLQEYKVKRYPEAEVDPNASIALGLIYVGDCIRVAVADILEALKKPEPDDVKPFLQCKVFWHAGVITPPTEVIPDKAQCQRTKHDDDVHVFVTEEGEAVQRGAEYAQAFSRR